MSEKIAIVKLGALGDVVRTTVLLKPLHAQYPDAEIWWFTSQTAEPLLKRNPHIHTLVAVESWNAASAPKEPFDLVLSLDEDVQACHLATGLKPRRLIGAYEESPGVLRYTNEGRAWFDMGLLHRDTDGGLQTANALKRQNKKTYPEFLFEMAGIPQPLRREARPLIIPDSQAEAWAAQWAQAHAVNPGRRLIGLNTGAGKRWTSKQMSIPKTLELANALKKLDRPILLLGGREEAERNRLLVSQLGNTVIDAGTDNSLPQFISLINLCDYLVTSDSLAMHLGTALGKKVIVFFGPTSDTEIDLCGQGFKWLPHTPCECYYKPACTKPVFCLDTLDVNDVTRTLSGWLSDSKERV